MPPDRLSPRLGIPMKPLFRFAARRHAHAQGVVALLRRAHGVGLAHLLFESGYDLPRVAHCFFQTVTQPQAQVDVVAGWVRQYGLKHARFVGLLDREAYLLFPTDAPLLLPREEWGMNLRWKLADRIHYPPEEAVVELFDLPGSTHQGESGKIYVAVAQASTVQREVDLFVQAGLPLLALDILDLALGRLTDPLTEDAQGLGLLFWTGQGGVVHVRRNRTLFLARTIETKRQQVWHARPDAPFSSPLLEDSAVLDALSTELRRTFDFYENNFLQPPLEHLFVIPVQDGCLDGSVQRGEGAERETFFQADRAGYAWPTEPLLPPLRPGSNDGLLLSALSERLEMRVEMLPLERVIRLAPDIVEADLLCCLPGIGAALGWGSG